MPHNEEKYPAHKVVGYNIRKWRKLRGFTIHELAVYARISESTLSRVEQHRGGMYLRKIGKVAEILEVELSDLFEIPNERLDIYVERRIQHSRQL